MTKLALLFSPLARVGVLVRSVLFSVPKVDQHMIRVGGLTSTGAAIYTTGQVRVLVRSVLFIMPIKWTKIGYGPYIYTIEYKAQFAALRGESSPALLGGRATTGTAVHFWLWHKCWCAVRLAVIVEVVVLVVIVVVVAVVNLLVVAVIVVVVALVLLVAGGRMSTG
jgi:hypothetical protein